MSSLPFHEYYANVTRQEIIMLGKMLDENCKNDVYERYARQCAGREEKPVTALYDFVCMCMDTVLFLRSLKSMPLHINDKTIKNKTIAMWRLKVGL